jgi:sugar lactone lactonase YvrE
MNVMRTLTLLTLMTLMTGTVAGTAAAQETDTIRKLDAAGREFVYLTDTASAGVHVLPPVGKHLGLIPTPRPPITVAFSVTDQKTLYVPQLGAVGPDGKPWKTPQGVRNTAMTIYTIRMLAEGFKGRPK